MNSEVDNDSVQSVKDKILGIIAEQGVIDRELLKPEATLDDLGVQSIDVVMILNEIEEVFDIYIPVDQSMSAITNVGSLVDHIYTLVSSKQNSSSTHAHGDAVDNLTDE